MRNAETVLNVIPTGEPDALKGARPVGRGADGKVLRATGVTRRRPTLHTGWRWFITEWDPETGLCFGLVEGFEAEIGYFDLTELAEATVFGSVPAVERDLYWKPMTIGEIRRGG